MIMKKFFIILLSVFLVGCGANTADYDTALETGEPELSGNISTEEPESEKSGEDATAPEQTASKESSQEQETSSEEKTTQNGENAAATVKSQDTTASRSENTNDSGASNKQDTSEDKGQNEASETPADTKQDNPQQEPVSYSPDRVVSLAIAKCQAGGMVTTTDNLASLLAEGSITQEEYNEYYPYDGLGYYSVFVETDLNEASTTSGQKLNSEEAIAQYIADMLLLETDPIFNIGYAGVTSKGGTDYYEFRCYR